MFLSPAPVCLSENDAPSSLKNEEEDFLPFSRPCFDEATFEEVVGCMQSGWLATGPRVQQFEEALRKYFNVPYALSLTSATIGLELALRCAGIQPGDEVITTPMTFIATINVIVNLGARPVFVDIEPRTYNIDVSRIKEAITPKTKAILPVHFAGLPVDLDPLMEIAQAHGLRVIEDAAHAMGSAYKNQKIGSVGDLQVFSFHPCKNMTTAEGGCVTTHDPDIARRLSVLRFHGIDRDAWNRYSKNGSHHFDVIEPGYKANMSDLQAAFGIHQIAALDSMNSRRGKLAEAYLEAFREWPQVLLPETPTYDHVHSWHIFPILIHPLQAGLNRDHFVSALKELNIGAGIHYPPVHLYTYLRNKFGFKEGDFPIAEEVGQKIVSLPLFPSMTSNDQGRVIEAMKKIFRVRT